MKYLFGLIIFSPVFLFCQKLTEKNLKDYVYHLLIPEPLNGSFQGNGIIFHYENNYYLITAFHLLTGRVPETGQLLPHANGQRDSVIIKFKQENNFFVSYVFDIKDNKGTTFYKSFNRILPNGEMGYYDIVILPLMGLKSSKKFQIKSFVLNDIDTNSFIGDKKLLFMGYKNISSKKDSLFKYYAHSKTSNSKDFVFSDQVGISGTSGGAVFIFNNNIKLAGIISKESSNDSNNYSIKSESVALFPFVSSFISYLKNQKPNK